MMCTKQRALGSKPLHAMLQVQSAGDNPTNLLSSNSLCQALHANLRSKECYAAMCLSKDNGCAYGLKRANELACSAP